jgi:hypothetical protein
VASEAARLGEGLSARLAASSSTATGDCLANTLPASEVNQASDDKMDVEEPSELAVLVADGKAPPIVPDFVIDTMGT